MMTTQAPVAATTKENDTESKCLKVSTEVSVPMDTTTTLVVAADATNAAAPSAATTETTITNNKRKARKHSKDPPLPPSIPSTLVPVRVDVSSQDKTTRVVDTLLLDPSCLPINLYSPLAEAVEDNVREIAYQILSDAECYGMTRPTTTQTKSKSGSNSSNVPSFIGRLDFHTTDLQTKAEDQLRSQLWKIIEGKMNIIKKASRPTISAYTTAGNDAATTTTQSQDIPNGLVPISIRLYTVHRIIIHEDIWWDPVSSPLTPIEFARELAHELNLPDGDEAVIAITTCMLEQLYGLPIDDTPDVSAKVTQQIFSHNNPPSRVSGVGPNPSASSSVIEASLSSKEGLRGAYQMSENNNRNAVSQFAQQHRVN